MSRLDTVRHELLALHRALLDSQRSAHEANHGKLTSGAFLELVIGAPEFAWLRPLTALIVGIDEAIDEANPDSPRARRLALMAAKQAAVAGSAGAVAVAESAPNGVDANGPDANSADRAAGGDTAASVEALLLADTRKLLTPEGEHVVHGEQAGASVTGEFQRRYAAALRDAPELAIAHASVLRALALAGGDPR